MICTLVSVTQEAEPELWGDQEFKVSLGSTATPYLLKRERGRGRRNGRERKIKILISKEQWRTIYKVSSLKTEQGVVGDSCNPSTWGGGGRVKEGEFKVIVRQQSKSEDGLGFQRSHLKYTGAQQGRVRLLPSLSTSRPGENQLLQAVLQPWDRQTSIYLPPPPK